MDFRRLFDILPYQQARYPQKIALAHKQELKWKHYSAEECQQEINRISAGLLDMGLKKGDRLAIMTHIGSPQWNFLDIGMQQIGLVVVAIHANFQTADLKHIFRDAAIKYCFVSTRVLYDKVAALQEEVKTLKKVYTLHRISELPNYTDICREPMAEHLADFQGLKAAIHEDDLATIIYTSGATGKPKGVMLSHKNIVSNIKSIMPLVPINCDKRTLSFLPLSHIFERMVVYTYMAVGASVFYAERADIVMKNLKEVRPHYFVCVPRLLEKMYDGILEAGEQKGKIGRRILKWALDIGEAYRGSRRMAPLYWGKLQLADLLVFRAWRRAVGGQVQGVIVGAAALQPKLGRLFSAAGIDIREGYGLTETSPVIAFNRFEPGGVKFGTVGIPIPSVEIRIDQPNESGEGEIWVKGPNVMMGYLGKPEETAAVMTEEAWFKTGDIGKMVDKRFLQITDRKKDIFKTSSGKYVAPQLVERKLIASPFIEQCMVVGFNRPYVSALVVPSYRRLEQWCKRHNVHWTSPQFMAINPKVMSFMDKVIEQINEDFNHTERVKKVHLLHQQWTVEAGEYTPTLKLRRPYIAQKYEKEINAMYS
ncbi:MAG: long-chain fatty acid--CoA ligase [Bacteroidota bacterium]